MHYDLALLNGTIVTGAEEFQADVYIKEGRISLISSELISEEAVKTIDVTGLHILPGLLDTHVHSRDPGPTYKEDFYHSTRAAAAGGITTLFEMPNTTPPVSDATSFMSQHKHLGEQALIDYGLWGICIGPLNNHHVKDMHQLGVIGFKFFWGYAVHQETFQLMYNYKEGEKNVIPPFSDGAVYEMMEQVQKTNQIFAVHAENNELIQTLTARVEATEGRSYEDLLRARPPLAEVLTVETGIRLARATGVRLHILHVSSGESVKLIRAAQQEGLPITVETCPHYLFLSADDYEAIGPKMKIYPPVKYREDQEEIWKGIADGTIAAVCSDHAPHTPEEKDGSLFEIPAGMCGVETLAPLMLDAVNRGKLTLNRLVQLLAEGPARLYGIDDKKGTLAIGSDADFTIVDMEEKYTIREEELHSKSKVSAYDGWELQGKPVYTIVRGEVVMERGTVSSKPQGSIVKPVEARKSASS
ncbi:allantoinase AllB [Salsuginibacillus kocurii]|uniref:allantoinase AllB n=1 Tax=Salsuginibacillus kocurii TaxID=427078 RepID=UPI00037F86DE|nr:allantoinase AllB [Salsuginibacillus kocurii]